MSVFVCILLLKQNENKREKVSSSTITTQNWFLLFVKKNPNKLHKHYKQQTPVYDGNKQTMGKENDKLFAVLYLPCSVIKPQQVLLSSHSHGYWKKETRNVVYAQTSGLILMCFNPKMPIDTLARVFHWVSWTKHIHSTQTEGNNKSKPFVPRTYFCIESQGWWAAHPAASRVPETEECLPVSAATNWTSWTWKHRIPSSSPWALVMDHFIWEVFFLLFYYFQAVKWWNIQQWLVFVGSHWSCSCPALCHHRWNDSV